MTTTFFSAWSKLFNGTRKNRVAYEKTLMTYAKTEYRNEWEFAYTHMLANDGHGPSMSAPLPIRKVTIL